ncbi:hypothetical protein WDU94_009576 [Cyamophila willieti]
MLSRARSWEHNQYNHPAGKQLLYPIVPLPLYKVVPNVRTEEREYVDNEENAKDEDEEEVRDESAEAEEESKRELFRTSVKVKNYKPISNQIVPTVATKQNSLVKNNTSGKLIIENLGRSHKVLIYPLSDDPDILRKKPVTKIILKPESNAIAGTNGTAIASPISRAIVRRGDYVEIDYAPKSMAVVGNGGTAQSEPQLVITSIEVPADSFQYYGGASNRRYLLIHPSGRTSISNKNPVVDVKGDNEDDDQDVGMEESPGDDNQDSSSSSGPDDGVSVQLPPDNASVAEAKPVGLAIAGVGGVASSKPTGTAVVGPGGLALSRPVATAIAGVDGAEALVGIVGSKKEKIAAASALKPTSKPTPAVTASKISTKKHSDEQFQLYNLALQNAMNQSSKKQLIFYPINES